MRYEITPVLVLVLVHVNSYQNKEQIKALGGKWKPEYKGWLMPDQISYDVAFQLCENVDEETDNRSAYYENYNEVNVDFTGAEKAYEKLVLPLKENSKKKKPVKSGQKFLSGYHAGCKQNEWIVISKVDVWGAGDYEIVCENLTTGWERRMSETEIQGCPWIGFDATEARRRFERRKTEASSFNF